MQKVFILAMHIKQYMVNNIWIFFICMQKNIIFIFVAGNMLVI